ncbi:MAG: protease modulator HflC [Lentisphaeria bacterium]|nr:protease modulator HflC [Lentisphaeria bacterium]
MNANSPRGRNGAVTAAVLAFALVFVLCTCLYQVRVTETAMIATLGRPSPSVVSDPGLKMKAPWPFQRVYRFDKRRQLFESDYLETLTGDGLSIVVQLYAAWSIGDPARFYNTVSFRTEDGGRRLSNLVGKAVIDTVGSLKLEDLLSVQLPGDSEGGVARVEEVIRVRIQTEAAQYGIEVDVIGFQHLGLPESTTQAVFDRMKAERESITAGIRAQGERDAAGIRTEADEKSRGMIKQAEAEAMAIRGRGESEAYERFATFRKDPAMADFALFLRKLEALEKTLKTKTTVILDRDMPPYDLLAPQKMSGRKQPGGAK